MGSRMLSLMMSATLVAASAALIGISASRLTAQEPAERSRTQGLKETDRFVKAGASASEAVANAKLQTTKTLDAYNTLVTTPSTNMKGDYKKLMKSVDGLTDRVEGARLKIAEMQKAGDVYFNGRGETIKNITDPELQDRAKQRLDDSQKQFVRSASGPERSRRLARAVPQEPRRSDHVPRERPDTVRDDRVEAKRGQAERTGGGPVYPDRQGDCRCDRVFPGSQSRSTVIGLASVTVTRVTARVSSPQTYTRRACRARIR